MHEVDDVDMDDVANDVGDPPTQNWVAKANSKMSMLTSITLLPIGGKDEVEYVIVDISSK